MSKTIYQSKIKVSCSLVHDENGYYHLVYKIVNTVNGKIYIGKHSTKDPYDDYMGSGVRILQAIKKYGLENFTKEILFCYNCEENAFLKEAEIVNEEFIKSENTYNVVLGGYMNNGSWCGKNAPMYGKKHTKETKEKLSKAHKGKQTGKNNPMYGMFGEKNPFYGRKHTKETKEKLSKAAKERKGSKNPYYGKTHTKEAKDKISKAKCGKCSGENNPMFGKHLSYESKEKISKALKGKLSNEKNPKAKSVIKVDEFGSIIIEYKCIKECCAQEKITRKVLSRIIKNNDMYNGFYFMFKSKN